MQSASAWGPAAEIRHPPMLADNQHCSQLQAHRHIQASKQAGQRTTASWGTMAAAASAKAHTFGSGTLERGAVMH